jgi:glycosyltransferase involved in cell wall biosynthesis
MIESQKKSIGGRYFLDPNLESLIEQLSILIENKSSKLNLDKARSIILERFSWSTVSARLLNKFLENE